MAKFDYALFYDFHTLATNPDVGKNFDVEAFTDQVKSCGVLWGYGSEEEFRKHGADYIVEKAEDIMKIATYNA